MKHFYSLFLCVAFSVSAQAQVYDSLVWADEFNVDGGLDTSKWFHQTLLPNNGQSWWNGEIQHYTDRDTNAYVDNGNLYLTAYKETYTDQNVTKDYTSARLNSKFAFTYGYMEIRAQLPTGVGTWPALWTLGQNITEVGAYWQIQGYGSANWPACGEIDLMEHWGTNQDYVQSALHTPLSSGNTSNKGGRLIPGVSNNFHVYAVEWTPTKMTFSVDSIVHYVFEPQPRTANSWPFDDPQYILMNIAIQSSIDTAFTSSAMVVDYVRVYQSSVLSEEELEHSSIELFPNPTADKVTVLQPFEHARFDLYDVNGRKVNTQDLEFGRNEIDMSTYASGIYQAVVSDARDGSTSVHSLVKE